MKFSSYCRHVFGPLFDAAMRQVKTMCKSKSLTQVKLAMHWSAA